MVSYCCVKGCHNNSNHKKKDPNSVISFHAFPSNPDHKLKWLRAIGRPDWEPPSHTRVCSVHFRFDQINHDSCRTRIKDDAFPVFALPPNSNFEASHLEVCRICLATDLKIYSLKDGYLRTAIESIAGFNDNYNIEGLPQFVCYECAASLMKCYRLIEKSMITQATLLDIFAVNGQITKSFIKNENRKQLNLSSSLSCNKINTYYELKYNHEENISYVIKNANINIDNDIKESYDEMGTETHLKNEVESKAFNLKDKPKEGTLVYDEDVTTSSLEFNDNNTDSVMNDEDHEKDDLKSSPIDDIIMSDDEDDVKPKKISKRKKQKAYGELVTKKSKRKSVDGLTPDEVDMQEYFTIVRLSLEEQIEEWDEATTKRKLTSETIYVCEVCSKLFAHVNSYRNHIANHDPSRGKAECPVCKLRFKSEVLAKYHLNRAHTKKFYCKTCHKVFNNVGVAKKHHRWHSGYRYRCPHAGCTFSSVHESAAGLHARRGHRREHEHEHEHEHVHEHACATCGRTFLGRKGLALHTATAHRDLHARAPDTIADNAYRCDQCNLNFNSEGARRVHLLTSPQHRKKSDLCDTTQRDPSLQKTCSKCGIEFKSLRELIAHTKTDHPRSSQKRTMYRLPDDKYPTPCEHCGDVVNNRKEHWWHVRRQHPKQKDSYRPVVTAVCDTCGKGFQNSTKLALHRLRHGRPSVRCGRCPRLFYDKYALRRHAAVHEPARPHRCRLCGRGFKLKCYLERHARVHTGVTPYECTICGKKFKFSTSLNLHVRTVHYKLPHPPRKKRTCKTVRNIDLDANNDNVM